VLFYLEGKGGRVVGMFDFKCLLLLNNSIQRMENVVVHSNMDCGTDEYVLVLLIEF